MSFEAKVYKILVASPGDVEEERTAIPQIISEWNNANAEANGVVLLPVKWETHSAPLMGQRPQGIINNQLIDKPGSIRCLLPAAVDAHKAVLLPHKMIHRRIGKDLPE